MGFYSRERSSAPDGVPIAGGLAIPRCAQPRIAFRVPARHDQSADRGEPAEQPIARALLRAGVGPLRAVMNFTRREFLAASAALVGGCSKPPRVFPGSIVGGGSKFGHRLREGGFSAPTETEETQVAIIGGGIAGLAAARRLRKQGIRDI